MGRPLSFIDGVHRHPEISARPVSTRFWQQRFQPNPPRSLEALLIKLGPFLPSRDAFRFDNDFILTDDQVDQIRQHYRPFVDLALGASPLELVRDALNELSVDVFGYRVGLPDVVIDAVLGNVLVVLVELLVDAVLAIAKEAGHPLGDGRCGGMAFSGYDFYLLDWTVDGRLGTTPPNAGVLGDYIFDRLLDSLDSNAKKFLEWFAILHILPLAKVSSVGKAALIAALATFGGPIGDLFAALVVALNLFGDLGGPKSLLKKSQDEWPKIKKQLDGQAACPIGVLFAESTTPFDDHQILAVNYQDDANGTALIVWDNRDGPFQRTLQIDFSGDTLKVTPSEIILPGGNRGPPWSGGDIKGFFLESYSPKRPPDSLHFTGNAGP